MKAEIEASLVVLLIAASLRSCGFFQSLWQVGRGYRWFSMALVFTVVAGHLVLNTFPFVSWRMYTSQVSALPVVVQYVGIDTRGLRQPFIPSRFLSSMAADRVMAFLERDIRRHLMRGDIGDGPPTRVAETIRALARRYHARGDGPKLESVEICQEILPLGPHRPVPIMTQRQLWRIDLK